MPLDRAATSPNLTAVLIVAAALLGALVVTMPRLEAQATPAATSISPVATPFVGAFPVWCTSGNPAPDNLCGSHHRTAAIDVGMDIGVEIRAAGSGVVVEVESACGTAWCRGGAGNFVAIEHPDGTRSRYLHLSETLVDESQPVVTGQVIGRSGDTGQSMTPHMHYDEQFPIGTRVPFGPWLACVEGVVVQYPDAFGHASWLDVPFGSIVRNDGYDCLEGIELTPQPPRIHAGPNVIGLSLMPVSFGSISELETTEISPDRAMTSTQPIASGRLLRMPVSPESTYSFRVRTQLGETWSAWSAAANLDPALVEPGPVCRGLYASGDVGTSGVDVLIGTDADDVVRAGAGDDLICTGDGNDTIDAGPGNDFVDAGAGHDSVAAGDGRDRVIAGLGRDEIDGGTGRDRIAGGAGPDSIVGGTGSDNLIGGVGPDDLRGGGGNDRVRGGGGDDNLRGGSGNDRLFGDLGLDQIDGGAGIDSCAADESAMFERCEP